MRMTKFLSLAVLLVALAATINALAFSTATVNNGFSLSVVNTTSAAIAISAADAQDPGVSVSTTTGRAVITVSESMQPGSTYVFSNVMKITNNAGYPVTINTTAPSIDNGTVTLVRADGSPLNGSTLANTASVDVRLTVTLHNDAAIGAVSGNLTVTATR